ncbi:SAM-dependent methyltransferase [Duganella sp. BJB488]|uniref:class I SAM-dependent methyltransferase n=1 Tax=unclassified Duganella TaxID=2636909 RepID=UPI000E34483F|nr:MULTISPECIES: class I SAM-dependent methyltransferase [unclassified Duganella]RFP25948.1 SAM-dependent methyltransferase [Duganella sp. BJB489]RFP28311.1 SAM-dependent methyltransferase [Duganella sp. BJB488]RFP36878.1 SAM-dependent methyltransferase [Duganella sp. BJB480]
MQPNTPSPLGQLAGPKPSAWMTATLRAAHQLYDAPLILRDPVAVPLLGAEGAARLHDDGERQRHPLAAAMRATLVVRARLAEDSWQAAHRGGVNQYVILGAGLDTYAYRADCLPSARLYEVDLPAMQQWKRACLRAAGIAAPASLAYVATDFEQASLSADLQLAGLDADAPACCSWLGVTMYLPADAVMRTLQDVAGFAPGSSIVFDYCVHDSHLGETERMGLQVVAAALAAQGEHLLSTFDPQALEHMLRRFGYSRVEHFGAPELSERYLGGRGDGLRLSGIFRMVRATV